MSLANNMANTYLRRDGEDSGMLNNLQMNANRIANVGDPVDDTDVVTKSYSKFELESLADVTTVELLPRMTSNNTPFPYQINSQFFSSDAYKCASAFESFALVNNFDFIDVDLGAQYIVDAVYFELSAPVEKIEIIINGAHPTDLLNVTGKQAVLFAYSQSASVIQLKFTLFFQQPSSISKLFIRRQTLRTAKRVEVHLPISPIEAINDVYLANYMTPLDSRFLIEEYIVPKMTSNTTPAPYSFTSPSPAVLGFDAYRVSDYNLYTNFIVQGGLGDQHILDIDLGSTKVIQTFYICGCTEFPNKNVIFVLEGSADDVTWQELLQGPVDMPDVLTAYENDILTGIRYIRMSMQRLPPGDTFDPVGINAFWMKDKRLAVRGYLTSTETPELPNDLTPKFYVDTTFVSNEELIDIRRSLLVLTTAATLPISIPLTSSTVGSSITNLSLSPTFNHAALGGHNIALSGGHIILHPLGEPAAWEICLSLGVTTNNQSPYVISVELYDVYDTMGLLYTLFRRIIYDRCMTTKHISAVEIFENSFVTDRRMALRIVCDSADVNLDYFRLFIKRI